MRFRPLETTPSSPGRLVRYAGRLGRRSAARLTSRHTDPGLWVIGGSSGNEYTDNSRALHEYLTLHRPHIQLIWLAQTKCPDRELIASRSECLALESVSAHRATRRAGVVIFSHGVHDVAGLYDNRGGVVVRVGHGLTSQRRIDPPTRRTAKMVARVDLMPVASEYERANRRSWGVPAERLPITGLARWDMMTAERAKTSTRDLVLLAPTWGPRLKPNPFLTSPYWRNVGGILHDARVSQLLTATGLSLGLFAHPLVRSQVMTAIDKTRASARVNIQLIDRGSSLPRAFARTALLITDYSSLAFDALYLDIPVAFFQFDIPKKPSDRSATLDLNNAPFGPRAQTIPELHSILDTFQKNGHSFPDFDAHTAAWSDRAFAYRDDRNCERLLDAIETRLHGPA